MILEFTVRLQKIFSAVYFNEKLKEYSKKSLAEIREEVEKWMDDHKFPQEKRTNLLFEVLKADLSSLNFTSGDEYFNMKWKIKYGDICNIHYMIPVLLSIFSKENIKLLLTIVRDANCICGNDCANKNDKDAKSIVIVDGKQYTRYTKKWFKSQIKVESKHTYSWGELYETLNTMSKNGDEHQDPLFTKAFELFKKLDNAVGKKQVQKLLQKYSFTEEELNRINSPCLDGILKCINSYNLVYTFLREKHSVETLKYFLDRGICKRHMMRAIETDRIDIIKLYIQRGADIERDKREFLRFACENNSKNCAKFFIDKQSVTEEAFLEICDWEDNNEIIQLFIDNGINVNCKGNIPLLKAFLRGHEETVKFLLEKGAKIINYEQLYNIDIFSLTGFVEHI